MPIRNNRIEKDRSRRKGSEFLDRLVSGKSERAKLLITAGLAAVLSGCEIGNNYKVNDGSVDGAITTEEINKDLDQGEDDYQEDDTGENDTGITEEDTGQAGDTAEEDCPPENDFYCTWTPTENDPEGELSVCLEGDDYHCWEGDQLPGLTCWDGNDDQTASPCGFGECCLESPDSD